MPKLWTLFFIPIFILLTANRHPAHTAEPLPEPSVLKSSISIVYCDYFPFYFKGGNGELRGILVDFWNLWSEKTDVPVTFSISPWEKAVEYVRDGTIDINAALFHTPERDEYFDFSVPFYAISSYFFHHVTVPWPTGYLGGHDLSSYRLGAVTKDFNTRYLKKKLLLNPTEFINHEQLVTEAINGKIDAFIMETPVAMTYLAKHGGLDVIRQTAKPLYTKQFRAGVIQGNKALLDLVNSGIQQIYPEEIHGIVRNWSGAIKPRITKVVSENQKSVIIAASMDQMPFNFLDEDGNMTGMLIDLWRLWGKKTGTALTFKSATWSDSLNLVRNGLADIHAGCFYSKERDGYLDYTVPLKGCDTHFFFHHTIFGLKHLDDLVGFKIGALENDYAADFVRNELPGAYIAEYPSNQALFRAVEKGEIRVFVGDTPTALYFLSKKGLLSEYRHHPARPLYSNTYFGAVKAGDSKLFSAIINGFEKITLKERASIERRWTGTSDYKTEDVLVIACEKALPPFSMLNSQGEPSGMFIDLWKLWAGKTGRKIEFRMFNPRDAVEAVTVGGADLHAGLRADISHASLSLSQPIYRISSHLFYRPEKKVDVLTEIKTLSVGVVSQSPTHLWLEKQLSPRQKNHIKKFDTEEALILAAANKAVDVFAGPLPVIQAFLTHHGRMGEFSYSPRPLFGREISGAVLKKNQELLRDVDAGMNAVSHKEFAEIEANWITDNTLRYYTSHSRRISLSSHEKKWIQNHPAIRLGAPPNYPPFDFIDNDGNPMGIASDYVQILRERLGIHIKLVPHRTWPEVIENATSDKRGVDLLSSVVATDRMREDLLFTDPYTSFPWVIITRKNAPLIGGLRDLYGKPSAVVNAYAEHDRLLKVHPQIPLVPVHSVTEGLKAVSQGDAEAYVGNLAAASYAIQNGHFAHLKIAASTPYNSEGIAFAVRNDWPELVSILNKGLMAIADQERDRIRQRWFSVRFEHGVDPAYVRKMVLIASAVTACLSLLFFLWNRQVRKARNAAQEANAAKSEFLASLSHEIRTPMNVIMGMTDITLRTPLEDSQRTNLKTARKAAGHLLELIDDILDLSKIEAGKVNISKSSFDLDRLLQGIVETYAPLATEKEVNLKLKKAGDVPRWITADPIRLRQILINLIGNAIKFTAQGSIEINVKRGEHEQISTSLCISVEDSGIGIPPNKLEIIFDSFTRVGRSSREKYRGTGLGLAICKKFAELMDGFIKVESQPGKGSVFSLILPLIPADMETDKEKNKANLHIDIDSQAQIKPHAMHSLQILVAEDSGPNAAVAKNFLTEMGHHVATVTNGEEAIVQLSRHPFNLVLMDVEMPELDGLEATHKIRNGEAGAAAREIPIIALTAHALDEYRQKCKDVGMNAFLSKPMNYEGLENAINQILNNCHVSPPETTKNERTQTTDGELFHIKNATHGAIKDKPNHQDIVVDDDNNNLRKSNDQDAIDSTSMILDRKGALARLGNNEALLDEIYSIFAQETPGILERLDTAIQEDDFETIFFSAHNLKSASDRIGALTCRDIAAKLETKAKKRRREEIPSLVRELSNAFETVMSYIG